MLTVEELLARARSLAHALPDNQLADRLRAATAESRCYRLDDFCTTNAHEFLSRAYIKLLLRPPDTDGEKYYLDKMAKGELTRLEVLYALATADEGAQYHITVDGLTELHQRLCRTPLLGWLRRRSGKYDN